MKRKWIIKLLSIPVLIFSLILGSCDEEETTHEVIEIVPDSIVFSAEGGTDSVKVQSDVDWASFPESDWIEFDVKKTGITISVEQNHTINPRKYKLEVISLDALHEAKLVIYQKIVEEIILTPEKSAIELNAIGQYAEIQVSCNVEWESSSSDSWLKVEASDSVVTIYASQNLTEASRTGTVTLSAGDVTKEITVQQVSFYDIEYAIDPDNTDMRDINSVALTRLMGVGWNIGNTLDAVGADETAWGNPKVTQQLIDSVKAAGFNCIRIPIAWSKFSDSENFIIRDNWMQRVEEVVNYVLNAGMYAMINIHWDGGWMQPTYDEQPYVNNRLAIMWEQIATHFRDYNDYLLFAGTNEVMKDGDYGTPTKQYYTVQNSFNQTFVATVRATGGRNVYRHLIIQGFNTNIDHTVNYATLPIDLTENRTMMEVHYYDPYNFTLNESSNSIWQWGDYVENESACESWANETYVKAQFSKMKSNFVANGVGVIMGEYGAISRTDVSGHETYRVKYIKYVTEQMINYDIVPVYWDNGYSGNHGFAIFNRYNGKNINPDIVKAIVGAVE